MRGRRDDEDDDGPGELVATISVDRCCVSSSDLRGDSTSGVDPAEVARLVNAWLVARHSPARIGVVQADDYSESASWVRVSVETEPPAGVSIPLARAAEPPSYVASGITIPYGGSPACAYEKVTLVSDAAIDWAGFHAPRGCEIEICGVRDELNIGHPPYRITGITWRRPMEIGTVKLQAFASLAKFGGKDVVEGALARKIEHEGKTLRAGDQVSVAAGGRIVKFRVVDR